MIITELYQRMMEYDYAMNKRQLELLENQSENTDALKLMTHLAESKDIWLRRLLEEEPRTLTWTTAALPDIKAMHDDVHIRWKNYLQNLNAEEIQKTISYKTSKGDPYVSSVSDCIMHVINHGTHHRGQVSMLIRQKGGTPKPMDFIFYVRESQS